MRATSRNSLSKRQSFSDNETQSEEQAIIKNILELDLRGFPPTHALLQDMANKLLAERHEKPVGIN